MGELLQWTTERFEQVGLDHPRVDAQHLLAAALDCGRMELYLQHDRPLSSSERAPFREMVQRRLAREPVAYILGRRGFHALDLELCVDASVLIPRPETEHLVDWLLEDLRPPPAPRMSVLDVGTGSGAIALAIRRARPDVDVQAVDISPAAVEVARANAQRADVAVAFEVADLKGGLGVVAGPHAAVAANLPYVPRGELAKLGPEVAQFEPEMALDGGVDGLDLVRALVLQLPGLLAPGGHAYLEVGVGQAAAVAALMTDVGLTRVEIRTDYAGIDRIVRGAHTDFR